MDNEQMMKLLQDMIDKQDATIAEQWQMIQSQNSQIERLLILVENGNVNLDQVLSDLAGDSMTAVDFKSLIRQ